MSEIPCLGLDVQAEISRDSLLTETLRRRIKNQTLPAFRLAGRQTILIERAALLRRLHPPHWQGRIVSGQMA